jgi:hypothetical protein
VSQKDIAFFAACHEERPLPFDVQLIVQLFSPEMLDAELDFAEFQHFVQVFCPEMLDLKLDFDGGLFLRARKTFSCRRVTMLDSMLDFLPSKTRTGSRFSAKTDFLLEFLTLKSRT